MSIYKPTWLYIKQHNLTGLKYFGKHSGVDPKKYKGSGTYWNSHLKIHGNNVTTVWCELFYNKQDLVTFATEFSKTNNIVESKDWANLKPESGLDGSGNVIQHWYNNGIDNLLTSTPPDMSWKLGRINQKQTTLGKKWFNNGVENKMAVSTPGKNWVEGILPSSIKQRKTCKGYKRTAAHNLNNSNAQKRISPIYHLFHHLYGNFEGSLSQLSEKYPNQKLNKVELWKLVAGRSYKNGYKGWMQL